MQGQITHMTTLAPCNLRPAQRAFTAQGGRQRRSVVTCAAAGQETDRRTLLAGLAGGCGVDTSFKRGPVLSLDSSLVLRGGAQG